MTTRNIPAVDRSIGVQAAQDYLTKKEYDEHRRTTKRKERLQAANVAAVLFVVFALWINAVLDAVLRGALQ